MSNGLWLVITHAVIITATPEGFVRTRARRAAQRYSDSPPLSVRIKNNCDRLTGEFSPWMKMDSINKITLKTAHNLARSNLLLSHVFTFSSHISSFDSAFILPPSPRSLTLVCSHPFLIPSSSYSQGLRANYAAKLRARESLHPVVSVEYWLTAGGRAPALGSTVR